MTFLWRIPETSLDGRIGTYSRLNALDRFELRKGRPIEVNGAMPTVRFDGQTRDLMAFDCLSNTAAPLVSQRVVQALRDTCAQDVQLVPARIEAADGSLDGWSLLNVTATVRAVNHKKSVYTMVPGTQAIMSFRHLEYLEGCLGEHQLARDAEYLGHLLVSDSLAQALSDFAGVSFERPEDVYYQPMNARWNSANDVR
ncbi:hypothetical protein J2W39_006640 [Variovorax paradoxus]|uniref:Uncharacterized protein n=1 Tax=Variovorax paradoxus TaxID=34073 RepID=A0AAW8EQN8_VARPD|nr:hypothetical protein [Variovorax paradoxus]MDP9975350.1 hypothetical protein [Variovorax paradoxus]